MELDVFQILQSNTILLMFVTLGLGFFVGRISVRGIAIGSTAGVLVAGLALGHLGFEIEDHWGTIGFYLFMYAVGLSAGPRFFGVIRQAGYKYLFLAIVTSVSGFGIAYQLSSWMEFDPGVSAGLLAGALTSTPTLAAAQDAVQNGLADLGSGTTPEAALQNITVAYALTYGFGMIGLILFIRLSPLVFRVDLKAEAKKAAREMHISEETDDDAKYSDPVPLLQAYELQSETLTGKSLKELGLGKARRFVVGRIKRDGKVFNSEPTSTLAVGDKLSVLATFETHQKLPELLGQRIQDPDLLDTHIDSCEVVISKDAAVNRALGDLHVTGESGLWVTKVLRAQIELPLRNETIIQRGDVMFLLGLRDPVRELARKFGEIEAEVKETDLPTFAAGVAGGLVLGNISVKLGRGSLTLGPAGGLLLAGIVVGFVRSLYPTFGRFPEAARWVIRELGLLFFMASVGLKAGSGISEEFAAIGPGILVCGVAVTLVPPVLSFLIGRWLLGLNAAILLGAICGSMTSTPALGLVSQEAKSEVPALGYAGTYTFANVLLTVAGSALMRM